MDPGLFLAILLLFQSLTTSYQEHTQREAVNSSCPQNFDCGNFKLTFPFADYSRHDCGLCFVDCNGTSSPRVALGYPGEQWFVAKSIQNSVSTMTLYSDYLQSRINTRNCSAFWYEFSLPVSPSISFTMLNNVTMFRCYKEDPKTIRELNSSFLGNGCAYYGECGGFIYYYHRYPSTGPPPALKIDPSCSAFYYPMNKSISKHINKSDDVPDVFDLLSGEFDLQWHISNDCADCRRRGGLCQTDWSNERHCINAETKSLGTGRFRAWIWIVVAVSVSTLLLLIGFVYCKKAKARGEEKRFLREQYIHHLTASDSFKDNEQMRQTEGEGGLNILSFSSIVFATEGFAAENKLGEGGFGPVYKGKLLDGREIAVKRLSKTSGQGLVEFKNELTLISKLQHTNLVRVLGCCIHEEEKMLIYEYMPNKSLDFFLFAEDKKHQLDWEKRFSIIEGIAQGLLYLHKYSRLRVIHRDLKASNVLLDEKLNPKIADFGMARIFKQNETEAMTNRVVGTYGYMAPEYAMEGAFSIKSDVFSFGVLMLEIVSGRRNSSFHQFDEERPLNLIGYAWELWKEGLALELTDPALCDLCDIKQLLRSIHIGLLCVQESAEDRPTMSEVISMFNNESTTMAVPKKPAYFTVRRYLNADSTSSETGNQEVNLHVTLNNLTMSVVEAR